MLFNEINIRPNYIDYAKIFGMCLVIYAHYLFYSKLNTGPSPLDSSVRCILLFHMPLFFIISGFLYKGFENVRDEVIKIWKTLCVPYILLSLIATAAAFLYLIFVGKFTSNELVWNIIGIVTGFDYPHKLVAAHASPLWFVYALVIIRMIFLLTAKKYAILIPIMIGILVMHTGNVFSFRLDSALVGLLFFSMGYYGKQLIIKMMAMPFGYKVLLSVLCIIILMLTRLNMGDNYCSIQAMNFGKYPIIALLGGAAGTILVLFFSRLVSRLCAYSQNKHPNGGKLSFVQHLSTGMIVTLGFHKLILTFLFDQPIPHGLNISHAIGYTLVTYLITCLLIVAILKYFPILAGRKVYE